MRRSGAWEQQSCTMEAARPPIHRPLQGPTQALKSMPAHVHSQIKVFVKGGRQYTQKGERDLG